MMFNQQVRQITKNEWRNVCYVIIAGEERSHTAGVALRFKL